MKTAIVAQQLKALGVPVISHVEGTYSEDGEVVIAKGVHVQVPTRGKYLTVVAHDETGFLFYPERKTVADLKSDIDEALKLA